MKENCFVLANLKKLERAIINKINNGPFRQKLIDLGFLPGTEVIILNKAPFGDPIEISLRGYNLSLDKFIAKNIFVNKFGLD